MEQQTDTGAAWIAQTIGELSADALDSIASDYDAWLMGGPIDDWSDNPTDWQPGTAIASGSNDCARNI